MTEQEFKALGIEKEDLICLIDNKGAKIVGFLHETQIDLYKRNDRGEEVVFEDFGCLNSVCLLPYVGDWPYGDEIIASCFECLIDWIQSIEIIKKGFWHD